MSRPRCHDLLSRVQKGSLVAASCLALSTLACSGIGSPSTRPPTDTELRQQVADLETKLLAAEKRAIVGEVESARLRRRVHDLEEQLAAAQRRSGPQPQIEASAPEPPTESPLPDRFETANAPTLVAPDAALPTAAGIEEEDLEEALPAPDPPLSTPSATEQTTPAQPSVDVSTPSPETPSDGSGGLLPPDDATFAAYDAAYVLFHEKRYGEAEAKFVTFVSRYPNSELTDNAQFWIGESRYARRDYQGALEAFSATVANYPGGNKVPDAMLKAGKSLEALGRVDQARQTYLEIQRRFPETAVALAAQEQLTGLD